MTDATAQLSAINLLQGRSVDKPAPGTTRSEAQEAANEFEAAFLSELLGHMFEGLETDGPFGGGHGEKMMRSMLVNEYGKSIAARGGLGISDTVYKELITLQEGN